MHLVIPQQLQTFARLYDIETIRFDGTPEEIAEDWYRTCYNREGDPTSKLDLIIYPSHVRAGETFSFQATDGSWGQTWDVSFARVIAFGSGRYSPSLVVISDEIKQYLIDCHIEIDPIFALSSQCDPRIPIIFVHRRGQEYLIDGWHRLYKAIKLGWPEIPAIHLGPGDEMDSRLGL